jgi:hypothetical protein
MLVSWNATSHQIDAECRKVTKARPQDTETNGLKAPSPFTGGVPLGPGRCFDDSECQNHKHRMPVEVEILAQVSRWIGVQGELC